MLRTEGRGGKNQEGTIKVTEIIRARNVAAFPAIAGSRVVAVVASSIKFWTVF